MQTLVKMVVGVATAVVVTVTANKILQVVGKKSAEKEGEVHG